MPLSETFEQLGIALGLGLLVGLQRESVASKVAGFRTVPIVTIFGTVCAMLSITFGGWVLATGFLAVASLIIIGNVAMMKGGDIAPGVTTEVALLLMFGVGAYLVVGQKEVAVAVGGGLAVLLQMKERLHGLASRLGDSDVKAIMRFALISMVILPILPDRSYGPFAVLNPRQIWLMIVLIVGISLTGYITYKFFGERTGVMAGGVLGGLISSTATTVSYAKRTRHSEEGIHAAAAVIMIATAVVLLRMLFMVGVVGPILFPAAFLPLAVLLVLHLALCLALWARVRGRMVSMVPQENPTELRPALLFGGLYAVVLLAVAAAHQLFGDQGMYMVASAAGLSGLDAITLSTSRLVNEIRMSPYEGWTLLVLAMVANLLAKVGIVAVFGHPRLFRAVALLFALPIIVSLLMLMFWPARLILRF
jgi:uncharacterized membrane protein (DUF4010 family)